MGNSDNITEETFEHLSAHWKKPLQKTKLTVFQMLQDNKTNDSYLKEMFEKAAKAWGQSVDDAKKHTYQLLKNELKK